MASEWRRRTLKELVDIKHGFAFPGENFSDEPQRDILLTPGNFALGGGFKGDKFRYYSGDVPDEYVLTEGDLIVSMTDLSKQSDTLGYPALVPNIAGSRFLHNQRLGKLIVRASGDVDELFLYYLLRTAEYRNEVLAGATGTTVKHTSPNRILAFSAAFPPIWEQKRIARILKTIDDKIEVNRKRHEALEAMARALFKSWFVDFDPVRARAEGRDTGLPEHIASHFPDALVDSPLGQVPQGWNITTWGTIATLEYGKSLSDYDTDTGMYPVYGTNGRIGTCSKALCLHPGVIVGRKGAYRGVHYSSSPFFAIDTAFYVAPKIPIELRWAYYELLRLDINGMDSGSAIPSTSREDFYSLSVVLAPHDVQQQYTRLMGPMWQEQEQNLHNSAVLANLRDTLLPQLISGELRVPRMDSDSLERE
jgi:type I restriction enzyme, S subunit